MLAASIIRLIDLMMEVGSTSEMLINFYQIAWPNNPEGSYLHTCHCENLKSQKMGKFGRNGQRRKHM
jgi:hypothetical protein